MDLACFVVYGGGSSNYDGSHGLQSVFGDTWLIDKAVADSFVST